MKNGNKSFTVIELLVVISIISILSTLILVNYQTGGKQFALQRAAHKLAQDIRRVQEMAMAAKELHGEVPRGGYGIYFNTENENERRHYILFADVDGDRNYGPGVDEIVEDISIEKQVIISELSAAPSLTIVFTPPDPTITIRPSPPGSVRLAADGNTKSVCINAVGLIEIATTCPFNNSPTAVCDVDPLSGNPDTTFNFDGSGSSDPDPEDTFLIYTWDFGDGTTGIGISTTHQYSCPGPGDCFYTAQLTVADGRGGVGSDACDPVTVSPLIAGNVQGYAWSENIGWIDFCPGGTAPAGTHSACGELAGAELRGWAKLVSTGGWISLNCADDPGCTSGHRVTYNNVTRKFSGYAWSEDFGWICFNSTTCGGPVSFGVTMDAAGDWHGWAWSENIGWISFNSSDPGAGGGASYKVEMAP